MPKQKVKSSFRFGQMSRTSSTKKKNFFPFYNKKNISL